MVPRERKDCRKTKKKKRKKEQKRKIRPVFFVCLQYNGGETDDK